MKKKTTKKTRDRIRKSIMKPKRKSRKRSSLNTFLRDVRRGKAARQSRRTVRRKPRKQRQYGVAGIPVTDHRLFLARGRHAVAVLLARAIGNANQLRVSCHVVGNTNNPEAARQEAMQIAKMEATRTGEMGWSVVETCVTAIYQ